MVAICLILSLLMCTMVNKLIMFGTPLARLSVAMAMSSVASGATA
jgi:hypothetical protein